MTESNTAMIDELIESYDIRLGSQLIWSAMRAGDSSHGTLAHPSSEQQQALTVWIALKGEIYSLLCTRSRKYARERKLLKNGPVPIVTMFATAVAAQFGLREAAASAVVAVAVLVPLKLGINTWCATNKKWATSLEAEERRVIAELANRDK